MGRFVVLYRGINVGGNNPVKMDALRTMHEGLGHNDVANYIQSGNIVLSAGGNAAAIAQATTAQFVKSFRFTAHIIVIPAARWRAILKGSPYGSAAAEQPSLVHAVLCDGKPDIKALAALHGRAATTEKYAVKGDVVYLHSPDGVGRSKFVAGLERACGVPITVRNWRTMEAVQQLLEGST